MHNYVWGHYSDRASIRYDKVQMGAYGSMTKIRALIEAANLSEAAYVTLGMLQFVTSVVL